MPLTIFGRDASLPINGGSPLARLVRDKYIVFFAVFLVANYFGKRAAQQASQSAQPSQANARPEVFAKIDAMYAEAIATL